MSKDCKITSIYCRFGPRGPFNTDKCVVLWLHPQQVKNNDPQYQLNGKFLRCVSHQRDLGVIVDETLKPNRQYAPVAKNANSIMRAIKASFIDITPALFHKLYGALIRPHVEYSFQAWRPWLKKDVKLLEDVQWRSTKLVRCLKDSEYEEQVQSLKLDSLSCRINKGDIILVYKILHGSLEGIQWRDFF